MASWGEKSDRAASPEARVVGATAAMLAIPLMREDAAAKLAEAEGIVCHLTSLVLVDEAGERHDGAPASRKVSLSTPRTAAYAAAPAPMACLAPALSDVATGRRLAKSRGLGRSFHIGGIGGLFRPRDTGDSDDTSTPASQTPSDLHAVAKAIDWDDDPETLRQGDLSGLSRDAAATIRTAALRPEIVALAKKLAVDPAVLVIALIAKELGGWSRSASRLHRAVLGNADAADIASALKAIGL